MSWLVCIGADFPRRMKNAALFNHARRTETINNRSRNNNVKLGASSLRIAGRFLSFEHAAQSLCHRATKFAHFFCRIGETSRDEWRIPLRPISAFPSHRLRGELCDACDFNESLQWQRINSFQRVIFLLFPLNTIAAHNVFKESGSLFPSSEEIVARETCQQWTVSRSQSKTSLKIFSLFRQDGEWLVLGVPH